MREPIDERMATVSCTTMTDISHPYWFAIFDLIDMYNQDMSLKDKLIIGNIITLR